MKNPSMKLLGAVLAVVLVGCGHGSGKPDGGADANTLDGGCTNPPDTASGITCEYLAEKDAAWRPATDSPMGFSVTLTAASYDNIQSDGFQPAQDQLTMLLQTGAACVRIDIGFDAWLNNRQDIQSDITNLVGQIRSAGKCLIVADASAEKYRKSTLTWTAFQQAWDQRVQQLYQLYTPDFYILVKEPGWYVPMVSDAKTNQAFQDVTTWVSLVQQLEADTPNSRHGVSIEGGIPAARQAAFVSFLKSVSALDGTDFIGFDQYGAGDQALDLSLASQIQTTKHIWIAEAWSTDNTSIVFDPARASLDAYWMQVEYDYAQAIGASNLIPFYDATFASYTQPTDYSKRTPVFYVFQQLAKAHGASVQ